MSYYNIRDVQPHKWAGTGKFMTSLPATGDRNIGVGVLLDTLFFIFLWTLTSLTFDLRAGEEK
jgi:hypothetical protein